MSRFLEYVFKNWTIPRYKKNCYIFGEMLSYAYMGKAVGYDSYEKAIIKTMVKLVDRGIRPYTYEEMSATGWGHELPPLRPFTDEQEKIDFWLTIQSEQPEVVKMLQINFARDLIQELNKEKK